MSLSKEENDILLTPLDGTGIFISREEAKESQTITDAITDEKTGQLEIPIPLSHNVVEFIVTYLRSPKSLDISKYRNLDELILFQSATIWFGIDALLKKINEQIAKLHQFKTDVDILNSIGDEKSIQMIEKNLSLQTFDNQRLSMLKLFVPKNYNYVLYTSGEFILTDAYFESDEMLLSAALLFSNVLSKYTENIMSVRRNGYTYKYGTINIAPYTYIYGTISKNNSTKTPFEDIASTNTTYKLDDIFARSHDESSSTKDEKKSTDNKSTDEKSTTEEKKISLIVEAYGRKEYHHIDIPKRFTHMSNRQKYIIERLLADKNFIPDTIPQIISHIPGSEYKCIPIHITNVLLMNNRLFAESFIGYWKYLRTNGRYVLSELNGDIAIILDTKPPFNKYYLNHYGWKDDIYFIDKNRIILLAGEHSGIELFDLRNGQNGKELKSVYDYGEEVYAYILPSEGQEDGWFCLRKDRKLYSIDGKFIKNIDFPKVDEVSDRPTSSGNYIVQQGWNKSSNEDSDDEDSDDEDSEMTITTMSCYHPKTDKMVTIVSDPGDQMEFDDKDSGDYMAFVHHKVKSNTLKVYVLYKGEIIKEIEEKTKTPISLNTIEIKNNMIIVNYQEKPRNGDHACYSNEPNSINIQIDIMILKFNDSERKEDTTQIEQSIKGVTEKAVSLLRNESVELTTESQLNRYLNWKLSIRWLRNDDAFVFAYRNPLDLYTFKYCKSKNQLTHISCPIIDFVEVTETNCLVVRNGYSGTLEIWV